jgi:hypothetical protein
LFVANIEQGSTGLTFSIAAAQRVHRSSPIV